MNPILLDIVVAGWFACAAAIFGLLAKAARKPPPIPTEEEQRMQAAIAEIERDYREFLEESTHERRD